MFRKVGVRTQFGKTRRNIVVKSDGEKGGDEWIRGSTGVKSRVLEFVISVHLR